MTAAHDPEGVQGHDPKGVQGHDPQGFQRHDPMGGQPRAGVDRGDGTTPKRPALSSWTRNTLMGLAPLVALVLFFATKSWTWFLLVPVVGVLLYGARGDR